MDEIGLDTVYDIGAWAHLYLWTSLTRNWYMPSEEVHYAQEREGIPEAPRVLLKTYIDKGWLGRKTGRGFYQYD